MPKHFIIINGKGGVGKDRFVDFCLHCRPDKYVLNISSVDQVKDMAIKFFSWNGLKDNASRKLLSDIKDFHTKTVDGPFNYMKQFVDTYQDSDRAILFFHIREPEEIERFKQYSGAKTVLIKRPGMVDSYGNHADDEAENYDYDIVINNDGDLTKFKQKAELFLVENQL